MDGISSGITVIRRISFLSLTSNQDGGRKYRIKAPPQAVCNRVARSYDFRPVRFAMNIYRRFVAFFYNDVSTCKLGCFIVLTRQYPIIRPMCTTQANVGRVLGVVWTAALRCVRGSRCVTFCMNVKITRAVACAHLYHRVRCLIGFLLLGRAARHVAICSIRARGTRVERRYALRNTSPQRVKGNRYYPSVVSNFKGHTCRPPLHIHLCPVGLARTNMLRVKVMVHVSVICTRRLIASFYGLENGPQASRTNNSDCWSFRFYFPIVSLGDFVGQL